MQGRRLSARGHSGEKPSTSKQPSSSAANKTKVTRQELDTVFQKFDPARSGFVNIKKLKVSVLRGSEFCVSTACPLQLVMRALGLDCRAAEIDRLTDEMMENEAARAVCEGTGLPLWK